MWRVPVSPASLNDLLSSGPQWWLCFSLPHCCSQVSLLLTCVCVRPFVFVLYMCVCLCVLIYRPRALFVVRAEAKLINCPFSPLTLASWLRTANIGSLTADPHPNHVVNFKQTKLIRAIAHARPTSKGRKGRSPKPWFSNGIMVLNSKKRALFFSAGE